jgi:hypothetical protein
VTCRLPHENIIEDDLLKNSWFDEDEVVMILGKVSSEKAVKD